MDNLKQFDIKIFAATDNGVQATEFILVLQRWIQEHAIPGVLIDVADYSHIHDGTGVILVGHEYNLSIDYVGGRMGVLFRYKQPAESMFQDRLRSALQQAFNACNLLENEEEFEGRLRFDTAGFLFFANDRLAAPNDDQSYDALAPSVEQEAKGMLGRDVTLDRRGDDPRERLTIAVNAS